MLRGTGGEFVCSFEDAAEELPGRHGAVGLGEHLLGGGDHAVFTPLIVFAVHRFRDAIGKGEKDVACMHGNGGLRIFCVGKKADDGPGGFEGDSLSAAEDVGRIVASVDEGEETGSGVVLSVEEGGVTVSGGGFVDEAVDVADKASEVGLLQGCDAAEAGAQARHEECGGDAFTGDIPKASARRPSPNTKKS